MLTREQALTAQDFHYTGPDHAIKRGPRPYVQCRRVVGPRGGVTETVTKARRNGATKTWNTRPEEYSIPVKVGFRGYNTITHDDAPNWHTAEDCPLLTPEYNIALWWSGRYMIRALPRETILDCSAPGQDATGAVEYWTKRLDFDAPPELTRVYLASYGAWDTEQLEDHTANVHRLLWIICGNLRDDPNAPVYLGE